MDRTASALAASDAAACDALVFSVAIKVTTCGRSRQPCCGADDSVCGVAPNICADSADFNVDSTRPSSMASLSHARMRTLPAIEDSDVRAGAIA